MTDDPLERFLNYVQERDAIYRRKSRGDPWPWTEDPILQEYRFTEIYRERDRTSLHYQKSVRDKYNKDSLVLPGTVLYRWFNRISTCYILFNEPELDNMTPFERYIHSDNLGALMMPLNHLPHPHVTGAFIITGKPGMAKSEGVLEYFHGWTRHIDWFNQ